MERVTICCNTGCGERLSCQKFARALDVNSGKVKTGYVIVECDKFNQYEK